MTPNALLAIIVVSVATIFVAMIRSAPRNNGCDNHHFEEHRRTNEYEVECFLPDLDGSDWWRVEQRVVYRCAHEGCRETTDDYEEVAATEDSLEAITAMKENAD